MVAEPAEPTSATEDAPRPPIWSAFVLLMLPYGPILVALGLYRLGLSHGCTTADPCTVFAIPVADWILLAMSAAWLTVFGVLVPALFATSIIHRALEGFGPRLAFGGFLPAAAIVGTVAAPTIASAVMKPAGCSLVELGPACKVFGLGMEQAFALAGAAPWPVFFAAVPAAIYVVVYAIVLGADELAHLSRARVAARAAELAARQTGQPLPPTADVRRSRRPERPRKPLVYIPPKRR